MPPPGKDSRVLPGFRSPVSARSASSRIGSRSSCLEMGFGAAPIAPLGGNEQVLIFALMPRGVGRQGTRRSSRWIDTVACSPADVWPLIMGIVVTASGCRSMQNDVPPGKPIQPRAAVLRRSGLTRTLIPIPRSGPACMERTDAECASPDAVRRAGSTTQFGTPAPNTSPYGTPSATGTVHFPEP